MSELWLPLAIAVAVGLVAVLYLWNRRQEPIVFANEREEGLTRKLAQNAGCSLPKALAAVQHEIDIAPTQSDETLLKRAAYHYRQKLPEKTCQVYRDRVRG